MILLISPELVDGEVGDLKSMGKQYSRTVPYVGGYIGRDAKACWFIYISVYYES